MTDVFASFSQFICGTGAIHLSAIASAQNVAPAQAIAGGEVSGAALANSLKRPRDYFVPRLRAEVALPMHADADGVRFQVALPEHKHGVNFHLLGALDF